MMDREIDTLRMAAHQAGERVLQLATDGFETYIKHDHSPVTTADLEVNRILHDILIQTFPEDGWLSEEARDDSQRILKERVWIVDPIDGTKYFMKGIPQYSISVALVEKSKPVVAVVYNPVSQEMFSAVRGSGAWLNGTPIRADRGDGKRPVVLVSPPAFSRGAFQRLEAIADCRPMGSIAYTLALVAAGQADGTLNLDRLNEWDIAAGVLLVEEAGGSAVDKDEHVLLFNQATTSVRGVVAAAATAMDEMQMLVRTLR